MLIVSQHIKSTPHFFLILSQSFEILSHYLGNISSLKSVNGVTSPVCFLGVCVQVSLQIHTQVVKMKRSCVANSEKDPCFDHRTTFKLRSQHLDEACLRFELQQPNPVRSGERVNIMCMLSAALASVSGQCVFTLALLRLSWSHRASGPAGSAGVGSLHVRQGPAAAALDGHGQHTAGAGPTVAQTEKGHLVHISYTHHAYI